MSDKVKAALKWLTGILDLQQVQYQIVGGLAAIIYGGSREVADIDLYIHRSDAEKVLPLVMDYISKPLTHYVEENWDLEYFQLLYGSQKIEIGLVPGTRIKSSEDDLWHELKMDFSESVAATYQGIDVQVIPVDALIEYKRILGREVDLIDIRELTLYSAS